MDGRKEELHNINESSMNEKEAAALDYLEKHKIMKLFENITSSLIYSRPGK